MGQLGKNIYTFNFKLFGLFAFFYPIAILYGLYIIRNRKKIFSRDIEVFLSSILLFLLLLILQAELVQYGVVGQAIISYLLPILGHFGIIFSSLFGISICLIIIKDVNLITLIQEIKAKSFKIPIKQILHSIKMKTGLILGEISAKIKQKKENAKNLSHQKQLESFEVEIVQDSHYPINETNQQQEEEMEFDDNDINIQEYIVVEPQKKTQHNIKMLDEGFQPQKKTNPFDQKDFSRHRSNHISSSSELIRKIRSENALEHQINFTKDSNQNNYSKPMPRSSAPTPTSSKPKELPKTLQSTPLHKPFKPTPTIEEESTLQELEEFNEPIQEEMILEEMIQEEAMQKESIHEEATWQGDLATQEKFEEEETEESEEHLEEIEEEEELAPFISQAPQNTPSQTSISNQAPSQTPPIQSAPKRYSSAFELSPQNPQVRTSKVSSLAENEALLSEIDKGELEAPKDYALPPLSLLSPAPQQESTELDDGEIDEKIGSLLEKLAVFKIDGDVTRIYSGPIITTLEFRPAPNVKVSRIQSLENDIAMALEAKSIRIQAPIPGKNVVGIEIPNTNIQTIYLREIFESEIFKNSSSPLTLALGKDVVGNPFVTDLKKLPHLLIAGTTGSGKSVGVNAMILSLLYRNSPDDLKLMMVDPKMVEFMPYTDLPHLITPIITDPKKAVVGLANAVREMERRYTLMSQSRTKEIVSYNQKAEELGLEKFPYFVIIIDELADLMMTAGKEVEYSMARIAQMGRASGMHLIVATQSPRAEVLTGLIKTNLPAHLSYKVGTKIDASIIGCPGAETLLGRGDMLFTPPGVSGLVRLHAPWSSEDEVNEIVSYIKDQREVMYNPLFSPEEKESLGAMDSEELDSESAELLDRAKEIILRDRKTSTSYVQRRLGIGYNKAANIMEKLEQMGFVSPANSKGAREILG